MDGVVVLEDELPTISVSVLVTDSESDLVVRERVKKDILFFHHFPRLRLVVLLQRDIRCLRRILWKSASNSQKRVDYDCRIVSKHIF